MLFTSDSSVVSFRIMKEGKVYLMKIGESYVLNVTLQNVDMESCQIIF